LRYKKIINPDYKGNIPLFYACNTLEKYLLLLNKFLVDQEIRKKYIILILHSIHLAQVLHVHATGPYKQNQQAYISTIEDTFKKMCSNITKYLNIIRDDWSMLKKDTSLTLLINIQIPQFLRELTTIPIE
jgi:hypothetical protein